MGERWRISYPKQQDKPTSGKERSVQWRDPNVMALSIYRGVTYTNTTYKEAKSNTPIQNNMNQKRRSTSKR